MQNTGLDEAQAGIKIAGRNINSLRYADDTTLMPESKEERKSLSMKVKEESEKVGFKLNIQKMKIMASGPITSWQIDEETVENSERDKIPDFLTCLLRNLYAGQEATVRTGHGITDWFKIREGVCQACILSPCLFNLYAGYIM